MKPVLSTALGARMIRPRVVNTQLSPNVNATTSAIAASTPSDAAAGLEAEDEAEHDDDRAGDQRSGRCRRPRAPTSGAGRHTGSELKRSTTPFVTSVLSATPE